MDKYLGVIFGRPRHYHDDDIDQEFPDIVNDEDMSKIGPRSAPAEDCHIHSLVCHARLAQIAERISREVYSIKPVRQHNEHHASIILIVVRSDPGPPSTRRVSSFSRSIA